MSEAPRDQNGADLIQYVALLGLIALLALGAFRPGFTVPAWAALGLLAIAIGANPEQFGEWLGRFQVVRRNGGGNGSNNDRRG